MTTMADDDPIITPELIHFGWRHEETRHRDDLAQQLDSIARHLEEARAYLDRETEASPGGNTTTVMNALRQLAVDATNAYAHAAALDALTKLKQFTFPAQRTGHDPATPPS